MHSNFWTTALWLASLMHDWFGKEKLGIKNMGGCCEHDGDGVLWMDPKRPGPGTGSVPQPQLLRCVHLHLHLHLHLMHAIEEWILLYTFFLGNRIGPEASTRNLLNVTKVITSKSQDKTLEEQKRGNKARQGWLISVTWAGMQTNQS
jgi:hypothetical protein